MAKREHTILVLQGGGALGAYQAGVYEGIAETGLAPNWIAGVSIGAINRTGVRFSLVASQPCGSKAWRLCHQSLRFLYTGA
jgi:predicted patatin/cPLA2 family phospholipase